MTTFQLYYKDIQILFCKCLYISLLLYNSNICTCSINLTNQKCPGPKICQIDIAISCETSSITVKFPSICSTLALEISSYRTTPKVNACHAAARFSFYRLCATDLYGTQAPSGRPQQSCLCYLVALSNTAQGVVRDDGGGSNCHGTEAAGVQSQALVQDQETLVGEKVAIAEQHQS